jgi:ketosteroid isomerase-like protein
MSHENFEIVRRAVAALNERDVDRYLELCTPDIELISPVAGIEGSSKGAEGIRTFFSGLDEATRSFHVSVERLEAVDERRVLALIEIKMQSERGVSLSQPAGNIYEVVNGKLQRVRVYTNREEALEAAGLSE